MGNIIKMRNEKEQFIKKLLERKENLGFGREDEETIELLWEIPLNWFQDFKFIKNIYEINGNLFVQLLQSEIENPEWAKYFHFIDNKNVAMLFLQDCLTNPSYVNEEDPLRRISKRLCNDEEIVLLGIEINPWYCNISEKLRNSKDFMKKAIIIKNDLDIDA